MAIYFVYKTANLGKNKSAEKFALSEATISVGLNHWK